MLQNFRSTQVNNISIQIIYRSIQIICRSIRAEEYESNFAPRPDNLKLLIARSIKIYKIFKRFWNFREVLAQKHLAEKRLSLDKS